MFITRLELLYVAFVSVSDASCFWPNSIMYIIFVVSCFQNGRFWPGPLATETFKWTEAVGSVNDEEGGGATNNSV